MPRAALNRASPFYTVKPVATAGPAAKGPPVPDCSSPPPPPPASCLVTHHPNPPTHIGFFRAGGSKTTSCRASPKIVGSPWLSGSPKTQNPRPALEYLFRAALIHGSCLIARFWHIWIRACFSVISSSLSRKTARTQPGRLCKSGTGYWIKRAFSTFQQHSTE